MKKIEVRAHWNSIPWAYSKLKRIPCVNHNFEIFLKVLLNSKIRSFFPEHNVVNNKEVMQYSYIDKIQYFLMCFKKVARNPVDFKSKFQVEFVF